MGDPPNRRATYEDLLDVPKNLVAEIINGTLVTMPRPASRQALESARWVLLGTWRDDAKVRAAPFEAFELELAGLWAK